MTINGIDISTYGAKQWNVTPGFVSVSNSSMWAPGSLVPSVVNGTYGFKPLKVVLMVYGESRYEILAKCSNIISLCLKKVDLVLDGFEHIFTGNLTKHSLEEKSMNKWHKLTLEFNVYEHGELTVYTFVSDVSTDIVVNPTTLHYLEAGNIPSPCTIRLNNEREISSIYFFNFYRRYEGPSYTTIDVHNLSVIGDGSVHVIDGVTGFISSDILTAPSSIVIKELPSIPANGGYVAVAGYGAPCEITISYRPMFA